MNGQRIGKQISLLVALIVLLACVPVAFATDDVLTITSKETVNSAVSAQSAATKAGFAKADGVSTNHTIKVAKNGSTYTSSIDFSTYVATVGSGSFYDVVQKAFDYARQNNDGSLWRVVIPKGEHSLGSATGLYIYSNTILDLRAGATIYAGELEGQILRSGRKDDSTRTDTGSTAPYVPSPGGYDDYENIYVLGGTFYGHPKGTNASTLAANGFKGCNIRFGHATGIHLLGVTVNNNVGAHHVELGAVKDCEIVDCTFKGSYGDSSIEAVQLDITHRHTDNFTNYWPFDDLPTINTTIENCLFENVTRGVGSHHLILGANFNNITIKNNEFKNIADRAIAAGNFTNSIITGNKMTNVNSGIYATNMIPGQTYVKIADTTYTGSKTLNMNLKITNNTIAVKNNGTYKNFQTKYGIRVGGAEITSSNNSYNDYKTTYNNGTYTSTKVSKSLPVGKYYITGVTIANNTVTGGVGNITAGMMLDYLAGSTVEKNKISAGTFNVEVKFSNNVKKINNNTLSNPGNIALYAYKNSTITEISGNTISNAKLHGISVRDGATVGTVSKNSISKSAGNGLNLENNTGVKITSNVITGSKGMGMFLNGCSKANISNNTVKQSKDHGIRLNNSPNSTLTGNMSTSTINTTEKFEISIGPGSKGCTVKNNKLGTRRFRDGNHVAVGVDASSASTVTNNAAWARLWGNKALDTMSEITKTFGKAKTAIVAMDTDFKDSLAAAALAGSLSAPMLTTASKALSVQTKAELQRMGVKTVYIIGTTAQVGEKPENQIKALGITVKRITGNSPSVRAVNCAKAQGSKSDTVIIATQANFKDALSISPYAYATKSPVLYIETNKKLSSATVNYIKQAKFKKALIVGGPVPIPAAVETQLKGAGIAANNITRLAGSNEYKTSRVIAEWATGKLKNGTGGGSGLYQYASIKFQPTIKLSANKLGVARADDPKIGWKDALAGAALCGKNKSVLLLCDDKATPYKNKGIFAEEFVKNYKASITQGYVFGGKGAVSESVFEKMVIGSK